MMLSRSAVALSRRVAFSPVARRAFTAGVVRREFDMALSEDKPS